MKRLISMFLALWIGAPLAAHPHIFIDTGLEFHFDAEGRLAQVKVTWVYDEFYSLLITEDMALDPDFDGVLTKDAQARLTGFDMNWSEGFNGDLVILQGDRPLTLSAPMQATASLRDGRITTTHLRDVELAQTAGTPFQIKPYDKTFYTAYDVTLPLRIIGAHACGFNVIEPDLDAGMLEMRDKLAALDAETTPSDADLPDIGAALSSTVVVTCEVS